MDACNCCFVLHAVLPINISKRNLWVWISGPGDSRGCPFSFTCCLIAFPSHRFPSFPSPSPRASGSVVLGNPLRSPHCLTDRAEPVRAEERVPGGMGSWPCGAAGFRARYPALSVCSALGGSLSTQDRRGRVRELPRTRGALKQTTTTHEGDPRSTASCIIPQKRNFYTVQVIRRQCDMNGY